MKTIQNSFLSRCGSVSAIAAFAAMFVAPAAGVMAYGGSFASSEAERLAHRIEQAAEHLAHSSGGHRDSGHGHHSHDFHSLSASAHRLEHALESHHHPTSTVLKAYHALLDSYGHLSRKLSYMERRHSTAEHVRTIQCSVQALEKLFHHHLHTDPARQHFDHAYGMAKDVYDRSYRLHQASRRGHVSHETAELYRAAGEYIQTLHRSGTLCTDSYRKFLRVQGLLNEVASHERHLCSTSRGHIQRIRQLIGLLAREYETVGVAQPYGHSSRRYEHNSHHSDHNRDYRSSRTSGRTYGRTSSRTSISVYGSLSGSGFGSGWQSCRK